MHNKLALFRYRHCLSKKHLQRKLKSFSMRTSFKVTAVKVDVLSVFISISTLREQKAKALLWRDSEGPRADGRTDGRTKEEHKVYFQPKSATEINGPFVCFHPPSGLAPDRRPPSSTPSFSIGLLNSWRAPFQRAHWGALCGARINAGHVLAADYCEQAPRRRPRR